MNKVQLGKTGVFVSEVSLGCMLMGSLINKENSYTALDRFIEMSGDFLDTANLSWHGCFITSQERSPL